MEFKINYENAQVVFSKIIDRLKERGYPFNKKGAVVPQELVDCSYMNDLEHSLFWFYVCHYMRGAIDSNMCTMRLAEMRVDKPEFFIPKEAAKLSVEELGDYLKKIINYTPYDIAAHWIENSRRMQHYFNGDPRNIFLGNDFDQVTDRVRNKGKAIEKLKDGEFPGFIGFQHKMVGMLCYFQVERKLVSAFDFITAVDFHLLRVMLMCEVIIPDDPSGKFLYNEKIQEPARNALKWYIENNPQHTMVELGDALWLLSSNGCKRSPWNRTFDVEGRQKTRYRKYLERKKKDKDFSDSRLEAEMDLPQNEIFGDSHLGTFESWIQSGKALREYYKNCGNCALVSHCKYGIPAEEYYQGGKLKLRLKPDTNLPIPFEIFTNEISLSGQRELLSE